MVDLSLLKLKFQAIRKDFPENSNRKNHFLAYCAIIHSKIDLREADGLRPYGGIIGCGDSVLDRFLRWWKIMRLHAVLHDASGFVRCQYGVGAGYLYALPFRSPLDSCYIGHLSGILYCIFLKFTQPFQYYHLEI